MRCIDCDFNLENASVARRCPECGRPFDPDDVGTFIGEGHTRWARRSAAAPGWPSLLAATGLALLVLRKDFGPGGSFGATLEALLAGVLLGGCCVVRLLVALAARAALPKRRPRVVPVALGRWLLPIGIVLFAQLLVGLRVPRAAAFLLDRPLLEPVATGPACEPSAWRRIDTWTGTIALGAVWDDVDVWAFDPSWDWGPERDPRRGVRADDARECIDRLWAGAADVPGMREVRVPRLAIMQVAGTGYGSFNDAAWAYAPGAPDFFCLVDARDGTAGFGAASRQFDSVTGFERYRGDWFCATEWMRSSLGDRGGTQRAAGGVDAAGGAEGARDGASDEASAP